LISSALLNSVEGKKCFRQLLSLAFHCWSSLEELLLAKGGGGGGELERLRFGGDGDSPGAADSACNAADLDFGEDKPSEPAAAVVKDEAMAGFWAMRCK